MPTKFIKCPYCFRLTFVRYGYPRWAICRKVIDPRIKQLRDYSEISTLLLKHLPLRIKLRSGCYRKFMLNTSGNVIQ